MKMRKLLPLVLLALGALFLLTSCDAILDAIFPSNQAVVDVAIWKSDFSLDWSATYYTNHSSGRVTLYLTDVNDGSVTTAVGSWTGVDYTYVHYTFPFTKLMDHTYTLTAYYNSYSLGSQPPNTVFYDPSGAEMGTPPCSITMPYKNSGDSTGHSVNLYMYF